MTIKQFTPDRIDEVVRMAAEVWGKEQGTHDAEAARCASLHRIGSDHGWGHSHQAVREDGGALK